MKMDLSDREIKRYRRHIALPEIGLAGQKKIKSAGIAIIGAGGLGVAASQYLVAMGIGFIRIVDFDKISITNLHRQPLYRDGDTGKYKVDILRDRLCEQNPHAEVEAIIEHFSRQNARQLLREIDLVIDCSDNLQTRYVINDSCILTGLPFISAALYKFEGQLGVYNYNKGPSYRCVFPESGKVGTTLNCDETGVLGILPGILGLYQAAEAVKLLLGMPSTLSGKIMYFNLLSSETQFFEMQRREEEIESVLSCGWEQKSNEAEVEIDWVIRRSTETEITFIDVREPGEIPCVTGKNLHRIPLEMLEREKHRLSSETTFICFCESGRRSLEAVRRLRASGFDKCHSLLSGVESLINTDFINLEYSRDEKKG